MHEVAEIIRKAASANASVIFGVVQDHRMKKRVSITLVATGLKEKEAPCPSVSSDTEIIISDEEIAELVGSKPGKNGHENPEVISTRSMFK